MEHKNSFHIKKLNHQSGDSWTKTMRAAMFGLLRYCVLSGMLQVVLKCIWQVSFFLLEQPF